MQSASKVSIVTGTGRGMSRAIAETIPIRRSNIPDDITMMAVLLASDAAASVTGQAINVEGSLMP